MYNLFNRHIQPMFDEDHPDMRVVGDVLSCYWDYSTSSIMDGKLEDRTNYVHKLREAHNAGSDED